MYERPMTVLRAGERLMKARQRFDELIHQQIRAHTCQLRPACNSMTPGITHLKLMKLSCTSGVG